jgi:hypothetical protein
MSIFSRLADLTREIAGATRSARDSIESLRQEIATRRRALVAAVELPIPRAELVERFRVLVDERAERFRRTPPPGQRWTSAASLLRALGDPAASPALRIANVDEMFSLLCFVAGDAMKAGAERLVEIEGWQDGAPSAERPALIARLERELRDLETAEEQAIDAAAAAGVVVEHRPEVRERRREDAYQQQRRAEREAAAREREAEVNRVHEQRARGVIGRSEYLTR